MEVAFTQDLTYTTKGDVPIGVVARSLLANERLIHESAGLLASLYDGMRVEKVSVKVQSVSNTSPLRGVLITALFITYQDDLADVVPAVIQRLTGTEVPPEYDTLLTVITLIIAIYVVDRAVERFFPKKKTRKLKAEYTARLNELAKMADIDPKRLKRIVEERFEGGRGKSLLTKARDFFSPAMLERGVEIKSRDQVVVAAPAIEEIPTELDFIQEETRNVYDLSGVTIEIHRADIDYGQQGWVAVVADVSDRRKKIILPPEIEPGELYGRKRIVGDVTVVEEKQIDGDYAVKEYHLLEVLT